MIRNLSLQLKLPIFVSTVLTVVIACLTAGAYQELRHAQLDAADERLRRVSQQLADLTSLSFDARLREITVLAGDESIGDLLAGQDIAAAIEGTLGALNDAVESEQVIAAELRDLNGQRMAAVGDTTMIPTDYRAQASPEGSLGPLLDVGGRIVYAASANVVRDGGKRGTASLWRSVEVDSAGRRVLADLIGVDANLLFGSVGGAWTDLGSAVPPPPVSLQDEISRAESGPLMTYEREGAGLVFAKAQSLDPAPWHLVVELPEDVALAGVHDFLARLGLLAPLVLLAVACGAWFLSRGITRSLRETTRAAEAIAAGQTGQRVDVRGRDEVGRLATSFNTMAQRVEDSRRALRDLNASLQIMLDRAPIPIIALGLDGNVRIWNRASENTFGWSADEVRGKPNPLVAPDGDPLDVPAEPAGATARELRSVRRDGESIDLFVARAPTYSPRGEIDGHMLVCEDITARKRAEEKLEEYARELSRSNEELENFAYVASHDLREPLRMVRSFTQLLADRYAGSLDEDADRYINFAVDGATRMEGLINALLEYSRVDAPRVEVEPTSSEQVLVEALGMLAPSMTEAGAVVTHDPLPEVAVNPDQLLRVFQNLVGNAVKFHGDEPPQVHVSARCDGDLHVFSVRDNGIGIDTEYYDRIFVIFKRLHGVEEFGGAGMGLSICKKIVERHGGSIWVDSTLGEGSTFHFTLPAVAAMVA